MGTIVTIDPRAEAPFTADDALGMEAYLVIGQNRIEYAARRAEHAAPLFVATTQAVGNTNGNAYGEGGGGMQHLFWEHPILALPYKSTQISIEDGSPFVVTPQDLTDSATAEEWLALSANLTGRRTLTAGLSEERATLIYSVSQELFDFCQRSFSLPHYAHTITSMIRLAVTQTRRATPHIVLIHHQGEQVQVVV